jgi:putative ABC transport system substrate-binding protein
VLGDASRHLRVGVEIVTVNHPDELRRVLWSGRLDRYDGIVVPPQSLLRLHRDEIVAAIAAKLRLAIHPDRDFVEAGGLLSYGSSVTEAFRRAASYVDRIFKGELPIEQPTRFELLVNMRTAKSLGITFPPTILVRADEVIE